MVGKVEPSPEREAAWQAWQFAFEVGSAITMVIERGRLGEFTLPDGCVPMDPFFDAAALKIASHPPTVARMAFDEWWSEREAGGKA